jgi:hypothetical protein
VQVIECVEDVHGDQPAQDRRGPVSRWMKPWLG